MSHQAGHGIKCTAYVGEALGAGVVVEPTGVCHLAAVFCVNGGAVEAPEWRLAGPRNILQYPPLTTAVSP